MVAAAIRTIFAQPDQDHVHQQLDVVADTLSFTVPEVANLLIEAKADLLACQPSGNSLVLAFSRHVIP